MKDKMEKNGAVIMQKYELGRLLGQGTFAKVYYARRLSTGDSVAIKIIDKEKIQKVGLINQIKREISVMRMVRHPNIVELHEVMASKTKIYFAMEYARGGELFGKVAKGRLKEEAARRYFQQLIGAVDFCHSRGVYHRDLKPENLLLDDRGNLKITDFGLSALRETQRNDGLLHTTCGTPAYVAPEVIGMGGYDGAKADIWSCGVVLYVLMAGFLPFHDSNLMEMYKKISKGEFRCPQWFPAEVRKLLSRILDPNPRTRIDAAKLMENPWFKKGFRPVSIMNSVHSDWHWEADQYHRRRRRRRRNSQQEDQAADAETWEEGSSSPDTPRDVREAFSGAHLLASSSPPCPFSRKMMIDSSCTSSTVDAGEEEEDYFTVSCCRCSKESMKPAHMNAFDIISLSSGFNLSGLFVDDAGDGNSPKAEETRFTTDKPASAIVSRFEELAETGRFAIWKKKDGKMMLHSSRGGRKGSLAINAEIYEIAPTLHMVEVRKASGDTWEYNNFCKRNLRPALKDIVWTSTAATTSDETTTR